MMQQDTNNTARHHNIHKAQQDAAQHDTAHRTTDITIWNAATRQQTARSRTAHRGNTRQHKA